MSNLPDDFNHAAFDRYWGSAIPSHVEDQMSEDTANTEKLREILQMAKANVLALTFNFGSPSNGYDIEDIVALLDDMTPVDGVAAQRRLTEAASDAMARAA